MAPEVNDTAEGLRPVQDPVMGQATMTDFRIGDVVLLDGREAVVIETVPLRDALRVRFTVGKEALVHEDAVGIVSQLPHPQDQEVREEEPDG